MSGHQPGTTQHVSGGAADSTTPPWVDAALAVVVSGVAAWVWIEARAFPAADDPARDPAVLPLIIAVVLWTCALVLLLRSGLWWARASHSTRRDGASREPATPEAAEPGGGSRCDLPQLGIVAIFVAALVIYIWGAFELGYLVSTWFFLTAVTCALSGRPTLRSVALTSAVSAVCSVVVWSIFIHGLGVHLPPTWAP